MEVVCTIYTILVKGIYNTRKHSCSYHEDKIFPWLRCYLKNYSPTNGIPITIGPAFNAWFKDCIFRFSYIADLMIASVAADVCCGYSSVYN